MIKHSTDNMVIQLPAIVRLLSENITQYIIHTLYCTHMATWEITTPQKSYSIPCF